LDRRLGGPQGQSGLYGEEENLVPTGNRTPAVCPFIFLKEQEAGNISARIASLKLGFQLNILQM
jgi:hypothetical protein